MIFNMFNYCLIPFSYLVGCFPSGLLIARIMGSNITERGSGNVGATNVARVIGKKAGAVTLLLDIIKGCLGTSLPLLASSAGLLSFPLSGTTVPHNYWTLEGMSILAGFFTILGHCYSLPGLKGGKGVATALGVILTVSPLPMSIVILFAFGIVFALTRMVSCGSLAAAAMAPMISIAYFNLQLAVVFLGMGLVIWVRHKENIRRIVRGEEKRFRTN